MFKAKTIPYERSKSFRWRAWMILLPKRVQLGNKERSDTRSYSRPVSASYPYDKAWTHHELALRQIRAGPGQWGHWVVWVDGPRPISWSAPMTAYHSFTPRQMGWRAVRRGGQIARHAMQIRTQTGMLDGLMSSVRSDMIWFGYLARLMATTWLMR